MVRRALYVYECPDCKCMSRAVALTAIGGKVRDPCWDRDGREHRAVKVIQVLCWWCREYHPPEEVDSCMALPEKSALANGSTSSTSSALELGLLKPYPELWAFLTASAYPDGRKRQTGRLSLSFESGMLGLLLTDDQTGQYAFLNGRNLDDLLTEAELRLEAGSLHWKPSRYHNRKK